MDYSVLESSSLFQRIPAKDLRDDLEKIPHHMQCYDKGETVFQLMESAAENLSQREPGERICARPRRIDRPCGCILIKQEIPL